MVRLSDNTLKICEAVTIINRNMYEPVDVIVDKLRLRLFSDRHRVHTVAPVSCEETDSGYAFKIELSQGEPPLVLFVRPESIGIDNCLGPQGRGEILEPIIRIDYNHLPI